MYKTGKLASLRRDLTPRRRRARKRAPPSQPSWDIREKQRFLNPAKRSLRGASAAFAAPGAAFNKPGGTP
jgi:hypothetical protein